ncbi:MAG: hypothetical protein GY679_01100, partial [Mycoplasma sp.]|nr:hypothetical protein [Mycoplasma sp.]
MKDFTAEEKMMFTQIVNRIIKDGIQETFLTCDSKTRKEIVLAYFDAEIKRYEKFQNKIMTNPEARR